MRVVYGWSLKQNPGKRPLPSRCADLSLQMKNTPRNLCAHQWNVRRGQGTGICNLASYFLRSPLQSDLGAEPSPWDLFFLLSPAVLSCQVHDPSEKNNPQIAGKSLKIAQNPACLWKSEVPKRSRSKCGRLQKHANERKRAQTQVRKGCKRAQKSASA